MNILSIIPARGGSKGIPRKNIVALAGKPLIAWTIEASLQSRLISRTIVSSDDNDIIAVSKKFGAETMKRPKYLAKDTSPTEPTIVHVINQLKIKENYQPDFIVLLQATSPLRGHSDIDAALSILLKDTNSSALISVYELQHHPFKSFMYGPSGYLRGIINNKYPFMPRQSLPQVFMPNGAIYIVKTRAFLRNNRLVTRKTLPFVMSRQKSTDVDTLEDLQEAERRLRS